MICEQCGKEILDESKFCKYCGKDIKSVSEDSDLHIPTPKDFGIETLDKDEILYDDDEQEEIEEIQKDDENEDKKEDKEELEYYNFQLSKKFSSSLEHSGINDKLLLRFNHEDYGISVDDVVWELLKSHGYDSHLYSYINEILNEEYKYEFNVGQVYSKAKKVSGMDKIKILNKYKDTKIEDIPEKDRQKFIEIKKMYEDVNKVLIHDILIRKVNIIENDLDRYVKEAEQLVKLKERAKKREEFSGIFPYIISIIYSAIATFLLVKYTNGIEYITQDCFGNPDFIIKVIGVVVIIAFILFFVTAFIGCMMLLGKWYESIGGLAFIFCVFGVIYGPWLLISSIWRGHMELELGYSNPSMSDREVYNEYQKLQAIRKFNGRR